MSRSFGAFMCGVMFALAVPAVAHAGSASYDEASDTVTFQAAAGEGNDLRIGTIDCDIDGEPGFVCVYMIDVEHEMDLDEEFCFRPDDDFGDPDPNAAGCPPAGHIAARLGDESDFVSSIYPGAELTATGEAGDDVLEGGPGPDALDGGPGADRIEGGEGNDVVTGTDADDDLSGDEGDDNVTGGSGDDRVRGDDGDDVVRGEAGNDIVRGFAGDDTVDGGDGDDILEHHFQFLSSELFNAGTDDIHGGPGRDSISYRDERAGITLTLDDQANDGVSGEFDNVHTDVEVIEGSEHNDLLIGGAGPDEIDSYDGNDEVRGGPGNDALNGSIGNDTVLGEAGDDDVNGSSDDDTVDGGPGRDNLVGDPRCTVFACSGGPDLIRARDGEPDTISCGVGADTAIVDALDVVGADPLSNCETIDRPAAVTDGGGGGPGGGGGGVIKPPPDPNRLTVTGKLSIRTIAAKGLAIRKACPGACRVRADLLVDRMTARALKLGRKARRIAGARKSLLAAGEAKLTLKLKLSKKATRRFKKLKKATVTLRVRTQDAAGKTTTTKRKLELKR